MSQKKKKKDKKYKGPVLPRSLQITPASEWKTTDDKGPQGFPLLLPSGNTCLCRPIGAEAFLTHGLIPNQLLPIVQDTVEQAIKGVPRDAEAEDKRLREMATDPNSVSSVLEMANTVTVFCVLEPKVEPVPELGPDGEEVARDPEKLYVDRVDVEDKLFIMQFALGGTRDLERFRLELADAVAATSAQPSSEPPTVRAAVDQP